MSWWVHDTTHTGTTTSDNPLSSSSLMDDIVLYESMMRNQFSESLHTTYTTEESTSSRGLRRHIKEISVWYIYMINMFNEMYPQKTQTINK